MTTILFHGTSSKVRSRIKRNGFLSGTWFTTQIGNALEYARWAVMRDGAAQADVWQVEMPDEQINKAWNMGAVEPDEKGRGYLIYKFPFKPKPKNAILIYSEDA